MKTTIYLILILASHPIFGQDLIEFKTDYFSGSFEYSASNFDLDDAYIIDLNRSVEIELQNEMITISNGEDTNESVFDIYLKQLSLLSESNNFNLNDFGKTTVNDRVFYWYEFSKVHEGGFYAADVNLAYLTKFKDSFLLISATIISPEFQPNQSVISEIREAYLASLKKIINTIELNEIATNDD